MKTSEETTYEKLRGLILEGELPAGEFLSQRMLAERTGAVVITVRSCLRRLENDGLIENVPKWGVRIPVESEEAIQERYYVRELLEVGAVEKMLSLNIPGARRTLLEKAAACDAVKLTGPESFQDFARKHADLHLTITRMSGNKLLHQELSRLNFRSMMLSNSKHGWELQGEHLNASHHRDFVRSLFDGDRQSALQAAREHIRRGCILELATLRKLHQHQEEETRDESPVPSLV